MTTQPHITFARINDTAILICGDRVLRFPDQWEVNDFFQHELLRLVCGLTEH